MSTDDAALDRIYQLIADQGRAATDEMREHGRRMDAQFAAQNGVIAILATSVARQEQKLEDNSARIFGSAGTPGVLQHFKEENEKREDEIKKNGVKITELTRTITTIEKTSIKEKAYIVGFATAMSVLVKIGLSKIGIHFGN